MSKSFWPILYIDLIYEMDFMDINYNKELSDYVQFIEEI